MIATFAKLATTQLLLVATYCTYLPMKCEPVTLVIHNWVTESKGGKSNHD